MNKDASKAFWKLLPEQPTPADELCDCPGEPVVKLLSALSSNPFRCVRCNREARLQRLAYGEELYERVHQWNQVYCSVYYLWIDSGDYEQWALQQLEDIASYVNRLALELLETLNAHHRTYFEFFQRVHDEDWTPTTICPRCTSPLTASSANSQACERCSIVVRTD